MFELTPNLDTKSSKPIYNQLYEYIRNLILTNKLKADEKLPSIRYLSNYLGISKNTVVTAYDQLLSEGYLYSLNRSGIFVEKLQNIKVYHHKDDTKFLNRINEIPPDESHNFDLRNAQIDLDSFPYSLWRKVSNECICPSLKELLVYGEHQGEPELRDQIARYVFAARGVKCTWEQVLIGAGTQQSLYMLSLMLKDIDNEIAFEEPGYDGARKVFIDNGFKINPIELEADGISIDRLIKSNSKIVYVTPSHQFPCGMIMPAAKRLMLLELISRRNGYIIEDDYDGEFRYQGKPIPSLQGMNNSERVIYMGTFSKALSPAIRISYMILPEPLVNSYRKKCMIYEQPVSRLEQKTLQLFMEHGYWSRHIKKMRNIYKKKHDLLVSAINEIMKDKVDIIGRGAGLHLLVNVKNSMTEAELLESASRANVNVSPTSKYWFNKENTNSTMVFLGFAGIKPENINESIIRLSHFWF
ncbi:PLP-dependent aminotransferase family protein [Clostridium oryzae]|uniref:HTH-type transcriptional regulatory protein GabR n=1 Tax=Clostridium oryzae TaxID=1450648 RepID=A0A1V4IGV6_9CLOT|nr:PLP-dependent aminotransferase family protein [Clostridium oryzae]OPJ59183.1 HTH-type transcriptional regulatory protein GabR [Clostridium oryzae]